MTATSPAPASAEENPQAGGASLPVADPLLSVRDLVKRFPIRAGLFRRTVGHVEAVSGLCFDVGRKETLGLVGESGCGKSTLARMAVGLYAPSAGSIRFGGASVHRMPRRGEFQMVFQDPYSSLNPRWRATDIVAEPIRRLRLRSGRDVDARVAELLVMVGLAPEDGEKYPHEFSGGQRQRISIARALAGEPRFLVCDEPTSALDVSVQAQILNLLADLRQRLSLTYLFISHNLAVVSHVADEVGVMYLGRLVELAPAKSIFTRPLHPYTRMLLDAIPDLERSGRKRQRPKGEAGNSLEPPSGCTFHPRCAHANERCRTERPERKVVRFDPAVSVACHAVEEGRLEGISMGRAPVRCRREPMSISAERSPRSRPMSVV